MIIRSLKKLEVDAEPYLVWNAFVEILAMGDEADLSPEQRPAQFVFWYESEVQNGGHFQFFENWGAKHLAVTIDALGLLGAICQQQILREAGDVWLSRSRPRVLSVKEFCDTALDSEFEAYDSQFYSCSPSLQQILEAYLESHQSLFVRVT